MTSCCGALMSVNLDLVEGVLDDGGGHHGWFADELSIGQMGSVDDPIRTLSRVSSSELLIHNSSSSVNHDVQGTSNKMTLQGS